eukprot:6185359-Pleurochrysis_carterae.AAC.2
MAAPAAEPGDREAVYVESGDLIASASASVCQWRCVDSPAQMEDAADPGRYFVDLHGGRITRSPENVTCSTERMNER